MKGVFLDLAGLEDLSLGSLEHTLSSLDSYPFTPAEQVIERASEAEVLIVNKVRVDASVLAQLPKLKMINVAATGLNNIDLAAAAEAGVCVQNCQAYGTGSVVQHVIGMIFALNLRLVEYANAVKSGAWQRHYGFSMTEPEINELWDKTLGIVGYGTLGQGVAKKARALGMNVLVSARPGAPASGDRVSFDQLLEQADVLSLHCPLTPETQNLIGESQFKQMKSSALLINAARGGLVDEHALVAALAQGEIAGAAVDVLPVEPPVAGNPLIDAEVPNLIVTPHNAWASRKARERVVEQLAENIQSFKNGNPERRVN